MPVVTVDHATGRNGGAQTAEIARVSQPVQVRQRGPVGFQKNRVHAIDAENNEALAGGVGGRVGGEVRAGSEEEESEREAEWKLAAGGLPIRRRLATCPTKAHAATSLSNGFGRGLNSDLPSM
jgi:hypothetical protein